MRSKILTLAALLCAGLLFAQSFNIEQPQGTQYGLILPDDGDYPGQLFVTIGDATDPTLYFWNQNDGEWETIAGDSGLTDIVLDGDVILGDNEVDDITANGRIIQNVKRQEFNQSCIVREAADFTAELVSDAGVNIAICPGSGPDEGINMFEFRLDGAQASPFIVDAAGALDIDNDGISNEGVEIVVAPTSAPVGALVDVGTSPEKYFQVGFTIASIDGTDNFQIGWRLAAAYVDNQVNNTINTGGQFHWNSAAGNCVITTQDDGTDAEDETTGCDLSDAEEMHVRVHVNTDGTFDFFYAATEAALETATEVTQTNATGAAAAGDMMVPYVSMLNDTAADTELKILYVEVGEVQ